MKCFTGKNVITSLVWSAATSGLVLAVAMPASLNATDKIEPSVRSVVTPTFEINGVTISAHFGDPELKKPVNLAGGSPVTIVLSATNTTEQPITVRPTLHLNSTAIPSVMSRTVPTPQQVYQQEQVITLGPGETKNIVLKDLAVMPQSANVSVVMFDGPKNVYLASARTTATVGETPAAQAR